MIPQHHRGSASNNITCCTLDSSKVPPLRMCVSSETVLICMPLARQIRLDRNCQQSYVEQEILYIALRLLRNHFILQPCSRHHMKISKKLILARVLTTIMIAAGSNQIFLKSSFAAVQQHGFANSTSNTDVIPVIEGYRIITSHSG